METLTTDLDLVALLEAAMLCAVMAVGVHASYTDIRWRQIPNGATWGLLAVGVAGQLGFWALGAAPLQQVVLTVLAGFGVGYMLNAYGFWAAGDAKLFWGVVVALPPPLFPPRPFFSFDFPLWAVLVNALLVNLVVVLGSAAVRRGWHRERRAEGGQVNGGNGSRLPARTWLRHGAQVAATAGLVLGSGLLLAEPLTFLEGAVGVVVIYLLLERMAPRWLLTAITVPGIVVGVYFCWSTGGWWIYASLWGLGWAIHTTQALIVGGREEAEPGGDPQERTSATVEGTVPFAPAIVAAACLAVLFGSSVIHPLAHAVYGG